MGKLNEEDIATLQSCANKFYTLLAEGGNAEEVPTSIHVARIPNMCDQSIDKIQTYYQLIRESDNQLCKFAVNASPHILYEEKCIGMLVFEPQQYYLT